jgi:cytochrome c5
MIQLLTISVITFGIAFLNAGLPAQNLTESIKRGKEVYSLYCQNCHLEDGKGTPDINPPVAKADYLKKPSKTLINVLIFLFCKIFWLWFSYLG